MRRRPQGLKRPASRTAAPGFTLVELMISAALMAVLLGAAYACLRAGLETRKVIEPRGDSLQTGRVAMDLIAADLRLAGPLHKGPQFLGMQRRISGVEADNLDFATLNHTPQHPGEGDYCSVSWYADQDPVSGELHLWRRRNPMMAFDPLSGGDREEIAAGVRGLQLEYYDGFDWYDTWGDPQGEVKQQNSNRDRPNLTGMPEAVRITLLIDSEPATRPSKSASSDSAADNNGAAPPLRVHTVVRLNLAGVSTGTGSSPGGNVTGTTPSPGAPAGGPF